MAEKVLLSIATGITQILGPLAKEELVLLLGVGDELEKLKNTVSTIQAVLVDAEQQQHGNPPVENWLAQLEDILYDADDLLDDISTEALRQKIMKDKMAGKVRTFFSIPFQLPYRFEIGHKIKAIRKRLDAAAADKTLLHLEKGRVVTRRERDSTHHVVHPEQVFGREGDKEAVIRLLMDSNVEDNVSVVSIVGLGGLGKTTLAKLIFDDAKIKKAYELKLWVCVSDTFVVKDIVKKILESAAEKPKYDEMDPLVSVLRQKINGKKYLLVLDDVWNKNQHKWSNLKELLMDGANGSRILVTTRDENVAKITSKMEPYVLRGMDEQSSWNLFKQVAFKNIKWLDNPKIVEMGRKILEKCVGVPLTVKTIGYLLSSLQNPEIEWSLFISNELSKISQNEDDILPTLKLSYDHLPPYLKQCFTYCSLFPKDDKMDKSLLISLWIAQGFIKSSVENGCLEDIGHNYFTELLAGSFFQEVETDDFGNISCKMHDLMHDLARKVVGSWITILGDEKTTIFKKTRHLSVNHLVPTSLYKASGIRTFFYPYKFGDKIHCKILFTKFKSLRSLDLHGRDLEFVPNSIGALKHLRYLDLSWNLFIRKLPNAITRLQNLQTLNLSNCYSLIELPRDIEVLVNLRHLDLDECCCLRYMPRGLSQLTNLQTLSWFTVDSCHFSRRGGKLDELKELNNLKGKLTIQGLCYGKDVLSEYKAANLKEKSHLHSLSLWWKQQGDMNDIASNEMLLEAFETQPKLKELCIFDYKGSRFPRWLWSLTDLVRLTLDCPNCEDLPPLSQLRSLKDLQLGSLKVIKYISDSDDIYELPSSSSPVPFFPSLEKLRLHSCKCLEGCWWRRDSSDEVNNDGDNSIEKASTMEQLLVPSFPRLSKLYIENCPRLTSMPMVPHLEELQLIGNGLKVLQMLTMNTSTIVASSVPIASSSTSLSKLKKIELYFARELENLQEEALQNLISLETLSIYHCHNLKSLSGIQHLTALKNLRIEGCSELELTNGEDWMQQPCLKSLLILEFVDLPKLVSLPLWLQHAISLQTLMILRCKHLMAIPKWFRNCTSSLQSLQIEGCPTLLRRCKREKGKDWHKIAHIPNSKLGFKLESVYNFF